MVIGTYRWSVPEHVIDFLGSCVASLPESLDEFGFRLVLVVDFGKGEGPVGPGFELQ
jgi:hypothetical protein